MNKHKMSKKLLATIMTFAMLITMFPSGVFAQDSRNSYQNGQVVSGTVTNTENGVTVNKYVTGNAQDGYELTLEGYASNQLTTTSTSTPLDIVLVLDVSSSMNNKLGDTYSQVDKTEWSYRDIDSSYEDYYYKDGDNYYRVKAEREWSWGQTEYSLYYSKGRNQKIVLGESTNNAGDTIYTGTLYVRNSGQSRLSAMQNAVNKFIDDIAKQPNVNQYKIGIVPFSDNAYCATGNLLNVKDKQDELKRTVSRLSANGNTYHNEGLEVAGNLLENSDSKKVVVLFTDGVPAPWGTDDFTESIAESAINEAYSLKQTNNVTIYTVGMFDGADPSDISSDFNEYMNAMSSNYPKATAEYRSSQEWWDDYYNVNLGDRSEDDYYFAADNADSLTNVFEGIAEDVTTGTLEVNPDETATLEDTLSQYFDLPADINEDQVKVKYVEATDYDPEKGFTFANEASEMPEGTDIHVDIDEANENIKVSGFDYKANAASYEKQDDGTYNVSGGKLVVTFPIEVDTNACLLAPVENGQYPTNDTKDSKAKLAYKANDQAEDNNAVTALNESPKVYFDNTKFDANGTDVTIQVYLDGNKVDPDQYVTLTRKTGTNDNWTYFNRVDKSDNVLTYDFNYNPDPESGFNCVDINVALNKDDVVLQGVHSYQSHGKGGTNKADVR